MLDHKLGGGEENACTTHLHILHKLLPGCMRQLLIGIKFVQTSIQSVGSSHSACWVSCIQQLQIFDDGFPG